MAYQTSAHKTEPPSSGTNIQSVARASQILLLAARAEAGITAKEAAEQLSLGLPTVYHLLSTLVSEGLLNKRPGRRYGLGPSAGLIAQAFARDQSVPERYLRGLQELADETGETAYLAAWRNGSVAVLSRVEGAQAVRVGDISSGYAGSEHARASGKLLMAYAPPSLRIPLLNGRELDQRTPNTITDYNELSRAFEEIVERGYALEQEEYTLGVSCVSAPISEADVVLAAYTVSVPVHRFEVNKEQLINAVVGIAAQASAQN